MNDVINVLNNYVCAATKEAQSVKIVVSNFRSFIKLLKSSSLQPFVAALMEQKCNDLIGFQKAFTTFHNDKKKCVSFNSGICR
jgi:hypothetical protein